MLSPALDSPAYAPTRFSASLLTCLYASPAYVPILRQHPSG